LNRNPIILALILCCAALAQSAPASAQKSEIDLSPRKKGQSSGLPTPRFVSLKADEVNVRKGPGWDHAVAWVFRRAGLPVEVIAEFDVWRQVRDSEGATGWVIGSLLSGRRTVLIAPWQGKEKIIDLYATTGKSAQVSAKLTPGVLGDVQTCDGAWCKISAGDVSGYIGQELLWGAYPGEKIN
jgi:SH3-like domain-containing protein